MARGTFGGSSSDFVYTQSSGGFVRLAAATLTFWTAETGGTQHADLLLNGSPVSAIAVGADGDIPTFQGPDGVVAMWASANGGARVRVVDLGNLATTDGATTALINDPASQTSAALSARARRLLLAGQTLASVQTWLDAITSGDVAQLVGTLSVSSPLTIPAGVTLDLSAATITQTATGVSTLVLGAGSAVRGGTINCPAAWDIANSGAVSYGVVLIPAGADNAEVSGLTINNVYKAGVNIFANRARVHGCRIEGNLAVGLYDPASTTGHFGVRVDPPGGDVDGSHIIGDNFIGGCVQGIMLTNFGAGLGRGVVITGNLFHDCWNHGIYGSSGEGHTITGNSFQRCQKPVVIHGRGHVVAGNAMFTRDTGDERDIPQISMRDPWDCSVVGNTIIGDGTSTSVAINLDSVSATTMGRNVVANNVIHLTGTTSAPAIQIGDSTTTECVENRIVNNIITAPGAAGSGIIDLAMAAGSTGMGNAIEGNTINLTGPSHVINVTRQRFAVVAGNLVRLKHDAPSAATLIMCRLSNATHSRITGNTWTCEPSWGLNINVRGVQEIDAGCDNNLLGPNLGRWQTGDLTSSTAVVQFNSANGSIVGAMVGEYVAATALGTLSGKVAVYDDKGTILGYAPVYTTIT